jgi:glycosyltransferase involved in cell wall biosynthesis
MRICIITPYSSPGWGGGITTHVKNVTKGLVQSGQDVTVVSGIQKESKIKPTPIDGASLKLVRGVRGDTFNPMFWEASRNLFFELNRSERFDIVLSEGSSAFGLFQSTPVNVPIVGLLHQFKGTHLVNCFQEVKDLRNLLVYILRTVPKILSDALFQELPFFRKCHGIICGADHIVSKIKRYYRINQNKIKTIPYWIDTDRFRPDETLRILAREKLKLSAHAFVFLIVSRIQKTKGIDIALEAFSQIFKSHPDSYLIVAGGGNPKLLQYYNNMASRLKIESNTIFTDMVPENDLPALYNAADVFIMPSLLTEVLPYTILEAMASGLPVITTKRPGNYEALDDSGIYVNIGDSAQLASAMQKIYQDNYFRETCSKQNYDRLLNEFTIEHLLSKWLNYLNDILERYRYPSHGFGKKNINNYN